VEPVVEPTVEAVEAAVAANPNILDMIWGAGFVVQSVLYLLILLSVWSWAITIAKTIQLRRAKANSEAFARVFWETRNFARIDDSTRRLDASPLSTVFASGYRELLHLAQESAEAKRPIDVETDLGLVERALRRAELEESHRLERGITFLATVASAAPFVGLFGTVWGVMNSFHGLGFAKGSSIQAVAPGISEALVATAVGLAAAIPSAVAFNYFTAVVRKFRQNMDGFSQEFLNIARRYFVK